MKQIFLRTATALLLSMGLLAPQLMCDDGVHDEELDQTLLQDELALLAYADHQRALEKRFEEPKHYRSNKKERSNARVMARDWREYQQKRELRHEGLGKFADLYRQPARPAYAQLTKQKNVFSVDVKCSAATKAFNNGGASMDVAQAAHADGAIRVRDVLFASELASPRGALGPVASHLHDYVMDNTGAVVVAASTAVAGVFNGAYLNYLSDKNILFKAEHRRCEAGFNLEHNFNSRLGLGVFIPVVEDKRLVDLSLDLAYEQLTRKNGVPGNIFFRDPQTPFIVRYGNDPRAFLRDVMNAKGMTDGLGGTSVGIGDVQFYAQARVKTHVLDQSVFSLRLVCPSAPQASISNFWAPERGNGGFFQTGLAFSGVTHYNRFMNLHFFVEGLYSLPATNNQRVPESVTINNHDTSVILGGKTPMGYRLDGAAADFKGFNSPFRGLGDKVTKLKIAKALALDVRVGNLFEEVFVRRANLDVFYNFKIKGRDRAYGLPEADYNLAAYEKNSDQVEHRLGGEWRWQVNHAATVKLGVEQVLWGKNVAQETQLSAGMNYGF